MALLRLNKSHMLPVIWLESALDDVVRITQYIAQRNPQAARNLSQRLIEDAETLGAQSIYYRQGRVAGTHEYVSHPNYIIVYRRTLASVEVLSVLHSRQEYP